jgi:PAS domain S-box-containing protein
MPQKPSYVELEERINELEKQLYLDVPAKDPEHLQKILDCSPSVIYTKDLHGRYITINKQFENSSGLQKKDVIFKTDFELFPEVVAKKSSDNDRQVIETGSPLQVEEIGPVDGQMHTFLSTKYPLTNNDGTVYGICGVSIDITERKQAEEALQKSEEQFRQLSDATFEAIVLHEDGIILHANDQYYEMFGYTAEELTGVNAIPLTVTSDSIKFIRNEIFPDNMVPYEVMGLKKDGTEFPIEVRTKIPGLYSRITRVAAIRDITERKRIDEKLNFLGHISKQAFCAVITTKTNFEINWTNEAFEKLYGYTQREVIGKTPDFLNAEPFSEKIQNDIYQTVSSGKYWRGEVLNKKKDGSIFPCEVEVSPLMDESDEIYAYVSQIKDNTEGKLAEEALKISHNELEKRVEERTQKLKEAHEQLLHSEKLAAIGKLTASLAHEINNPLAGIQSVIEGIKRDFTLDEDYQKLSDMALSECSRVKDLIKNLQDFNKPSSGVKEVLNIHTLLDQMLAMVEKEYKTANIRLIKLYTSDLPNLQIVPDQIKQVLLNLLSNAKDAIVDKNGVVTVSTENLGSKIAVCIKDNGSGISDSILPFIFDPFYSTKKKGSGLGLSVSYGIIKKHGGRIDVVNEPGRGTAFTIILPIEQVRNA